MKEYCINKIRDLRQTLKAIQEELETSEDQKIDFLNELVETLDEMGDEIHDFHCRIE